MNTGAFGFGTGFGQSQAAQSPFGATAPASPFGQTQMGFGQAQASSPFGATTSTGMFGGQAQSPFGAPASAFGSSSPAAAFGASPAFGAKAVPAFGGFGGASAASVFGTSQPAFGGVSTAPAFGSTAPAFGASQPTAGFGGAPAFGSPGAFGAPATPAFGAASTTAFGAAPSAIFGGFSGAVPAFGSAASGTRSIPFQKTPDTESTQGAAGSKTLAYFNHVSAMKAYETKSPEELRWEDYQAGLKGQQGGAVPGMGAAPQQAAMPTFGGMSAPSLFGAASSPAFGTSAPAFGASPAFGSTSAVFGGTGFGSSASAFGAVAPAFGSAAQPAFGSTAPFGSSTATTGFGTGLAFGAVSSPGFGQGSVPAFGAPASTPAFGGSVFGGFPQSAAAPAFGSSTAPAFGTSSPSLFGSTTTGTPFGTPASSPAPFGVPSTPAFSFASAPASGMSAPSQFGAPAFGLGGNTGLAFGGAGSGAAMFGAKPGFGGSAAFGAAPAAFGASTPLFGVAAPAAVGTVAAPPFASAFGAPGAFSFQNASVAPVPGMTVATHTPGVATSPYGTLPEAPHVAQTMAEHRVGISQRPQGLLSGGATMRPFALLTPRSIMPRAGVRMRSTRVRSSSRTPGGETAPNNGDDADASPASNNIFLTRENPRRLFVRDPLPCTQAAQDTQASPSHSQPLQRQQGAYPAAIAQVSIGSAHGGLQRPGRGHALSGVGILDNAPPMHGHARQEQLVTEEEVSRMLPKLGDVPGLAIQPSLTQLVAMARSDPASLEEVSNFAVIRQGIGRVQWNVPVDVRGLNVGAVVRLNKGSVEVYLDDADKPDIGDGLNKPASVTLENIFKIDRNTHQPSTDPEAIVKFTRKLERIVSDQKARFVSYDPTTGEWKFKVEHFSRYGLVSSDSEGEDAAVKQPVQAALTPSSQHGPDADPDDMQEGDDDGTPHEDVGDEADGSESTARMLEAKSTEADSRPLLISLPAQLRLDAAVMQDIREGLFSARDTSSRQVSDRGRNRTAASVSGQCQIITGGLKRQSAAKHSWLKVHLKGPGELQPRCSTALQAHGATVARWKCAAGRPASNNSGLVTQQRCLVDAGLLHGLSTRVSWTATGAFTHSCAAHVTLQRIDASSSLQPAGTNPAPLNTRLRQRWTAALEEHAAHSQLQAGAPGHAPHWSLVCSRELQLQRICLAMSFNCTAHQADGTSAVERICAHHEAWTWELLHALFSSIPDDANSSLSGQGTEIEESDSSRTCLTEMERKAGISGYLQDFALASTVSAMREPLELHQKILYLVSSQQVGAAAALAAACGDVRLATLLAQAGKSKRNCRSLSIQLLAWYSSNIEQSIDKRRWTLYQLLAGDVDTVTPELDAGWMRALAARLGFMHAQTASVAEVVADYTASVAAGHAPPPMPLYQERAVAQRTCIHSGQPVTDINYELLQLFVQNGVGQVEMMPAALGQLLRPAGYSPEPLDHLLSWHLLTLLKAIGAIITSPATAEKESSLSLALVAQLEHIGGMSQWAVYAAAQLSDPGQREEVVRSLLWRHAPEWAADPSAHNFLLERLAVPAALLAEAMAGWMAYVGHDSEGQLQLLMKANKWKAAHKIWADTMAVDTMASVGTTAIPMAGYVAAFEAHSADIADIVNEDDCKSWRFFQSLALLQDAFGEIGPEVPVCDITLVEGALARVRSGLRAARAGSPMCRDVHELQACSRIAEMVEQWVCRGPRHEGVIARASIDSLHELQCSAAMVIRAS